MASPAGAGSEGLDLRATLARHRAFWRRADADRPLFGCWQGGYFLLEGLESVLASGRLEASQLTPDVLWKLHEAWSRRHVAGLGDLLPTATPFLGIPWLEAIVGCPVVASLESGSIWAEPFSETLPDPASLVERALAVDNPWLAKLMECVRTLGERLEGRLPFGTPIMRGPTDLLASVLGGSPMVYAFAEEPDRVRAVMAALADIWIEVARRQLALAPAFHGGYGCYRGVWAPGELVTAQEDSSALLSPALYRDQVLPADRRIFGSFGHTLMHNHSASLGITIDEVLGSPTLAGFELTVDPAPGPSVSELIPAMRRIQSRLPLVLMGSLGEADLRLVLEELAPAGLAIYTEVASLEQAERYAAIVEGRG